MPSAAAVRAAHYLAEVPGARNVDVPTLAAVCAVFDIPIGTFNKLQIRPDRVDREVRSSTEIDPGIVDRMAPGIRDHPLFELLPANQDVIRMSDVISHRRWLRHPLYFDIIGPAGIPAYSALIPVEVNAHCVFVMLNRDRDFDDGEMRDMTFLQGAVTAVRRRGALHARVPMQPGSPLTRREHEVLVLLDAGLTVAAVARQLLMQPRTAAKHIESIHRKLGTIDRLSTVRLATQAGWLPQQR